MKHSKSELSSVAGECCTYPLLSGCLYAGLDMLIDGNSSLRDHGWRMDCIHRWFFPPCPSSIRECTLSTSLPLLIMVSGYIHSLLLPRLLSTLAQNKCQERLIMIWVIDEFDHKSFHSLLLVLLKHKNDMVGDKLSQYSLCKSCLLYWAYWWQ